MQSNRSIYVVTFWWMNRNECHLNCSNGRINLKMATGAVAVLLSNRFLRILLISSRFDCKLIYSIIIIENVSIKYKRPGTFAIQFPNKKETIQLMPVYFARRNLLHKLPNIRAPVPNSISSPGTNRRIWIFRYLDFSWGYDLCLEWLTGSFDSSQLLFVKGEGQLTTTCINNGKQPSKQLPTKHHFIVSWELKFEWKSRKENHYSGSFSIYLAHSSETVSIWFPNDDCWQRTKYSLFFPFFISN